MRDGNLPNITSMADESAGRSAQAQADARRARAQRILATADAYERGAQGEVIAANRLRELPPLFTVLHDLQVPGTKANIDHLVIGPAGVFVVDAKHYSKPLRVADGMIWRGRYSIRKQLDLVTWEAEKAAAVLGVPVHPMLCFVGSSLPVPVVDLPPVRVTTDDGLVPAILSGTAGFDINDISRLTLLAHRHLPAAATPTVTGGAGRPPHHNTRRARARRPAPARPASRPRSRRRAQKKQGSILGAIAMLAIAAVLMLNASTIGTALAGLVSTGLQAQTPAPVTAAAPALNGDFSCPVPGSGWTLTFQWPGDGAPGGYEYSTSADQTTWTPFATWASAAQIAPSLGGIGTDQAVHVRTAAAGHQGATATTGSFRSPPTAC